MNVVYIAGPYTGPSHDHRSFEIIDRNIAQARSAAATLARNGILYFCPHLNGAHFEVIAPEVPPEYWYRLGLELLRRCDAVLLLPGWENSWGTLREIEEANALGIPVFEKLSDLLEASGKAGKDPVVKIDRSSSKDP